MTGVFLDTVGLIALWDRLDQWHADATHAMAILKSRPQRIVTSSLVLLECGNAAARKPYRTDVDDLRRHLLLRGDLIIPTEVEVDSAWNAYRTSQTSEAGIVDQASFILMRRLGITDAFTNDRHFKAAGFVTLF